MSHPPSSRPAEPQPVRRGVFAIPPTPFESNGDLDLDGLRSVVDFCLEAGVAALVTPVNASEFTSLTDDERAAVISTVVEQCAGTVPVVACVAGVSAQHAVALAREAAERGAAQLIAMPPYVRPCNPSQIVDYYGALSDATPLPIWVQNNMPPVGTPMTAEFIASLVTSIPNVLHVKEETYPPGHLVSELKARCGPALHGLMGGMAGRFLLDEHRRGATGTMPACEVADVHVALWDLLEQGRPAEARALFTQLLPLLNMEFMYGVAVYKEVLHRRGVIRSTFAREPGHFALDAHDHAELDAILGGLQSCFTVKRS